MKKAVLALATAATIGFTALAAPSPAEAHWRGGGFGLGLAGGLIGAAVIGGIASSAYAYGPVTVIMAAATGPATTAAMPPIMVAAIMLRPIMAVTHRLTMADITPGRVIRPAYAYYGGPRYYGARYYGGGPRFYRAYGRW